MKFNYSQFWERGYFKTDILRFLFPVNMPGLGDRFIMTSNIISTMSRYKDMNCIVDMYNKIHPSTLPEQRLNLTDFYDVIDFFHFQRPDHHPHSTITTNLINEFLPPSPNDALMRVKAEVADIYHKPNPPDNYFIYDYEGKYYPINYDKTVKKKIITFMFYMDEFADWEKSRNSGEISYKNFLSNFHKHITEEQERDFNKVKVRSEIKWKRRDGEYLFVRLEDKNFKKNVELLSKSHLLIASEGMWAHLSRAMGIDTIAYSRDRVFIEEFNNQGHFCSGNFEECLTKLKEKCTNLTK
jgi:hypothetical protein